MRHGRMCLNIGRAVAELATPSTLSSFPNPDELDPSIRQRHPIDAEFVWPFVRDDVRVAPVLKFQIELASASDVRLRAGETGARPERAGLAFRTMESRAADQP